MNRGLIQYTWAKFKEKAVYQSGIYLSLQLFEDGNHYIVVDLPHENRLYSKAVMIHSFTEEAVDASVEVAIKIGFNTKKNMSPFNKQNGN